jgi:hypothetical protein
LFLIIVFDKFTDKELEEMEGNSRENVIARLKALRKIQDQLESVSVQLNQLLHTMPGSSLGNIDKGKQRI